MKVRDQHCRFPHCRRRAVDAELDHAVAWADGGETKATNLYALCGTHHRLKTHAGWRIEAHPNGRLTWITPTGHRYTTAPHDYGPELPSADASSGSEPVSGPADATTASANPDPPPF